ncbi:hypothetical protein M9Y10_020487 [Tritrichomonas musculus]|uniref:Myb-like DNA-binding domain containing protein n=1 Tax=Tritrichomonas musculus TaxID=1915356 RepID=A0ABR2HHC1_9EUKA
MQANLNSSKNNKRPKKTFTPEEDQTINLVVRLFGNRNWEMISTFLKGRTAKQCRDRYMNYLRPEFENIEWTQIEDDLILELYSKHGSKWSLISKYFPNRSQISIKNRYKFLQNTTSIEKNKKDKNNDDYSDNNQLNLDLQIENDNMNSISDSVQNYPDFDDFDENSINILNDKLFFDSEFEDQYYESLNIYQ